MSTKCSQSFGDSLTTRDNFSGFKPLVRKRGWSLTMVMMMDDGGGDGNDDDDEYDDDSGGGSEINLCETKAQLVLCHRHKGLGPPGQLVVGQVMVQAWAGDYQDVLNSLDNVMIIMVIILIIMMGGVSLKFLSSCVRNMTMISIILMSLSTFMTVISAL